MKTYCVRLAILVVISFNFSSKVLSTETLLNEFNDPSSVRKYGESLKYSPFLVDTYEPKQLIKNWATLNSLYTEADKSLSKEFGEDLVFKQQQMKRLLDNLETHIRSRDMNEFMAFNFQYVTFSQVCIADKENPEELARVYRVPPEVLKLYLDNIT